MKLVEYCFITEVVIPPEIKKRGPEAIRIFKEALDEGTTKIPYCSMLILGKEKMGADIQVIGLDLASI